MINTDIGDNQSTCYSNNATVSGLQVLSSADKTNSENANPQQTNLRTKSQLHKIILNEDDSTDYLAVCIYWDSLRSWYNPKKIYSKEGKKFHITKLNTKGIFLNYTKLSEYYRCSKETIRKKLVKLEQLGLIQRSFQHKSTAKAKSYNQLIVYVWKDTPHFFNSYGVAREEVGYLQPQTNHLYIKEKYGITFDTQEFEQDTGIERGTQQQECTKELSKLFSKEKIRSNESNFCQNSVEEKSEAESDNTISKKDSMISRTGSLIRKVGAKASKLNFFAKPKQLADFYPLSEEDCKQLQGASGREFSLNAMNEILLDMSKRLPDRSFNSKKGFISYMSKAFSYEMRDAVKVSNNTFKIKANQSPEQVRAGEIEQYLEEIESSTWITPEWHLKRKLANVLAPQKAYDMLQAYRSISIEGERARINLTEKVELSPLDKETILKQIKATHESVAVDGQYIPLANLEITMPELAASTCQKKAGTTKRTGIWGRVRESFIRAFGDDGEGIDQAWLSKVEPQVDEQKKTIELKAPSSFFKDYIEQRYLPYITKVAQESGFTMAGISC